MEYRRLTLSFNEFASRVKFDIMKTISKKGGENNCMNNLKRMAAVISSSATSIMLLAAPIYAADQVTIQPGKGFTNVASITLPTFIGALVTLIFIIAGLLATFYLILGGIKWITSGGDKAATQSAREQIQAAIIGLAVVLLSFAIMKLIGTFFGIDIFNPTIPSATGS